MINSRLAVAGLTVWTLARPDVISDATTARFAIETASTVNEFALSPDGRHVAFVGGFVSRQLWIRSIDALEPRALPGTEGAFYPFWSPGSRSIGFFADGKLKKVDVTGGFGSASLACSQRPRRRVVPFL